MVPRGPVHPTVISQGPLIPNVLDRRHCPDLPWPATRIGRTLGVVPSTRTALGESARRDHAARRSRNRDCDHPAGDAQCPFSLYLTIR